MSGEKQKRDPDAVLFALGLAALGILVGCFVHTIYVEAGVKAAIGATAALVLAFVVFIVSLSA